MTLLDFSVAGLPTATARELAGDELEGMRAELVELRARLANVKAPIDATVIASSRGHLVAIRLHVMCFSLMHCEVPASTWSALRVMFERGGFLVDDRLVLKDSIAAPFGAAANDPDAA